MYKEVFKCDRKDCKNECKASNPGDTSKLQAFFQYPYSVDTWIRRNTIENEILTLRDFCSAECELMWLAQEVEKREKKEAKA